jgi:hypothetical protein
MYIATPSGGELVEAGYRSTKLYLVLQSEML